MSFPRSTQSNPSFSHSGVGYSHLESNPRNNMHRNRDWRSALRAPPTYRIGNRQLRFNYHFALLLACVCLLFVLFYYARTSSKSSSDAAWVRATNSIEIVKNIEAYNRTYPLTAPVSSAKGNTISFRIGMVADLDVNSEHKKDDGSIVWRSYFKKGNLVYSNSNGKIDIRIRWDAVDPVVLESSFAHKGRGMELSELVTFNGKLLTFDGKYVII